MHPTNRFVRSALRFILCVLTAVFMYGVVRILSDPDPPPALGMITAASIAGVVAILNRPEQ